MDRFLFRAETRLDDINDIKCKSKTLYYKKEFDKLTTEKEKEQFLKSRKNEINKHILLGSQGFESNFISTTTRIALAHIYSTSLKGNTEFRTPIVLIDTSKLPDNIFNSIIDTTDPLQLEKYISTESTKRYALSSREVLIERTIPKEAYVRIPEPLVDALCAFEANAYISCKDQNNNYDYIAYEIMQKALCTAIIENKNCLNEIISTIEFTPLESAYYNCFYSTGNNRRNIHQICDMLGFYNPQILNALQTHITKKICTSLGMKTIISKYIDLQNPKLNPSTIDFIQQFINEKDPNKNLNYFNYYLGALITNSDTYSKTYYQQPNEMKELPKYTLNTQKKDPTYFCPNGGTLEINLPKKSGFKMNFPYSIIELPNTESNDNIYFKVLYSQLEYLDKKNFFQLEKGHYFTKKNNRFLLTSSGILKISIKNLEKLKTPNYDNMSLDALISEKTQLEDILHKAKMLHKEYTTIDSTYSK